TQTPRSTLSAYTTLFRSGCSVTLTSDGITRFAFRNVTDSEADEIRNLLKVWSDRLDRNLKRTLYYDGEQAFRDLGLTLPVQLRRSAEHTSELQSRFDLVC